MSLTGTVRAVDRTTWGDRLRNAWRVTITLPFGDVAVPIVRDGDTAPVQPGERVSVRRFTRSPLIVHRTGGDAYLPTLDYPADPDAPLH